MRIVIDINHPAHVHFFKNFIWEMRQRGHKILITAKDKDVTYNLLDSYRFDYIKLGAHRKSTIKKIIDIPVMSIKIWNIVKGFKPDIFVGLGSYRAAHASFLLHKKCIIFDDTEHDIKTIKLYLPFTNIVCTPSCFKKDLGKKQIRYNGYHELAYLHPNYFKPNPMVLDEMGLTKDDLFIILRFVAWEANHDIGKRGLDIKSKRRLVKLLNKYGKVFISSENELPKEFEEYHFEISPAKIHDALYYASMVVSEGGTIATEASVLGTPTIHITPTAKKSGIHNELQNKYELKFFYDNFDEAKAMISKLINKKNLKEEWKRKREKLVKDKINVTKWIINFIENQYNIQKEK